MIIITCMKCHWASRRVDYVQVAAPVLRPLNVVGDTSYTAQSFEPSYDSRAIDSSPSAKDSCRSLPASTQYVDLLTPDEVVPVSCTHVRTGSHADCRGSGERHSVHAKGWVVGSFHPATDPSICPYSCNLLYSINLKWHRQAVRRRSRNPSEWEPA